MVSDTVIRHLIEAYPELSEHQRNMLQKDAHFTGKMISDIRYSKKFYLIKKLFSSQLDYLKNNKQWDGNRFVILINAAPKNRGGQRGYLYFLKSDSMLEFKISSSWKGIGFKGDSGKTPMGYFLLRNERREDWDAQTILTPINEIFMKIYEQQKIGITKWLRLVNTRKEKAYMLSNQLALEGQNDGKEYVPLSAPEYYFINDSSVHYLDNTNSLERQLYIHGTNREEQLGGAFSGGCVRIDNIFSYVLKEIIIRQKVIPVFIDAIPYYSVVASNHKVANRSEAVKMLKFNKDNYFLYGQIHHRKTTLVKSQRLSRTITQPIIKILTVEPNARIYLRLSSSMPIPEKALFDLIEQDDSMQIFTDVPYQNTFDLRQVHYRNSKDPAVENKITIEEGIQEIGARLKEAKEFLLQDILKNHPDSTLTVEDLSDNIMIDISQAEIAWNEEVQDPLEYLTLNTPRKLVLRYYNQLLKLMKDNPNAFFERKELQWLSPFAFEEQIHQEGAVFYKKDGLMVQAYLYALGECLLRKDALKRKNIASFEEEGLFYQFMPKEESLRLKHFDEHGFKELLLYSMTESKTGAYIVGERKDIKNTMYNMLLLSEEYFSRFKQLENLLKVEMRIAVDNELIVEGDEEER
ncbi:hypothetical protein GCM10023331_02440 [Algivirga pacifica]|uniref:YkuD domain-containing protein n=2 Tax=Algivirga pacifica TaxID=1162670 RepID=A0ABP9D1C3_9BACT